MNDIRRFERRVLQHTEFDDDEGFEENANESINLSDMESAAPYEQELASKGKPETSFDVVPYTKPLAKGQIDPYILEIRRRLQEDIHARREREKRRRKVLVDQLRALEAIEVSPTLMRMRRTMFYCLGCQTRRIARQSFASSIAVRTASGSGIVTNATRKRRSQTESHCLRTTIGNSTKPRLCRSDGPRSGETSVESIDRS